MSLILLAAAGVAADPRQENLEAILQRMDTLWPRRENGTALYDLITLGHLALEVDPDSYEATWRAARAQFWVAHSQGARVVKKNMAARAATLAERATGLRPERVEGHYYYAVGTAEYAPRSASCAPYGKASPARSSARPWPPMSAIATSIAGPR